MVGLETGGWVCCESGSQRLLNLTINRIMYFQPGILHPSINFLFIQVKFRWGKFWNTFDLVWAAPSLGSDSQQITLYSAFKIKPFFDGGRCPDTKSTFSNSACSAVWVVLYIMINFVTYVHFSSLLLRLHLLTRVKMRYKMVLKSDLCTYSSYYRHH